MEFKSDKPHRRFNPLLKSWILVSPHRLDRPWEGQKEKTSPREVKIDPDNPLCPNAIRKNGEKNPDYKSIYLFKNDFPALLNDENVKDVPSSTNDDLFCVEGARGDCFVLCYDHRSNMTLATMDNAEVVAVIDKWVDLIRDQGAKYEWVQIFENRGEMMGCSNMHPHCQIWASNYVPHIPCTKDASMLQYFKRHNSPLLFDYLNKEMNADTGRPRIVIINDSWVCLVPFWAEWPYETMLLPRRLGVSRLTDLLPQERLHLAQIMRQLLNKYNSLFDTQCPYSMGWHGAPTGTHLNRDQSHWTLHASYYPPLLRSATIRKFFVGFELLAESQRDLTPETAAENLRKIE